MPSLIELLPLVIVEKLSRQKLKRTPEQDAVMNAAGSVAEYNEALSSNLALVYALSLESIYAARDERACTTALDLACGPGHFTVQLAEVLGYADVTGVDLSPGMVELANRNRLIGPERQVRFSTGDASNLSAFANSRYDLTTFCDAAHHMREIADVTAVLREMERLTTSDGLIYVVDLVRLHTEWTTKRYVEMIGGAYRRRGLHSFYGDFSNSMRAAWTASELCSAVPTETKRHWIHMLPFGLPTIQILMGLPQQRHDRTRFGLAKFDPMQLPLRECQRRDYALLRLSCQFGWSRKVYPC